MSRISDELAITFMRNRATRRADNSKVSAQVRKNNEARRRIEELREQREINSYYDF